MQEKIVIRVDSEFKNRLKRNADQSGMGFSQYVRFVLQGCPAAGHPEVVKELQQLRVDIARIGNNINQIAHAQNAYLFSISDKESLKSNMQQIQTLMSNMAEVLSINSGSNGDDKDVRKNI